MKFKSPNEASKRVQGFLIKSCIIIHCSQHLFSIYAEVSEMHAINESESIGGNICEELQGVLKSKLFSFFLYPFLYFYY